MFKSKQNIDTEKKKRYEMSVWKNFKVPLN